MKNLRGKYGLAALLLLLFFKCSCKKDNPAPSNPPDTRPAQILLKLNTTAGGQPFHLNHQYMTPDSQKYILDQLRFYMGNISLIKSDGSSQIAKDIVLAEYDSSLLADADLNSVGTGFTFDAP